jgi:hypothetical protein
MDKRSSFSTLEKRKDTESRKLDEIRAKIEAKKLDKSEKPKRSMLRYEIREMADEYEAALSLYKNQPTRSFKNNIIESSRAGIMLGRAVKFAKELEVDFETYIKGLFYVHDKWWNKHPSTREISDYKTKIPAKDRVSMYLAALEAGDTSESIKVVSPVKKVHIPQSVRHRNSELSMKAFMSNYSYTEEEVFTQFGQGTEAFLYFDADWLSKNETYLRLCREGKI